MGIEIHFWSWSSKIVQHRKSIFTWPTLICLAVLINFYRPRRAKVLINAKDAHSFAQEKKVSRPANKTALLPNRIYSHRKPCQPDLQQNVPPPNYYIYFQNECRRLLRRFGFAAGHFANRWLLVIFSTAPHFTQFVDFGGGGNVCFIFWIDCIRKALVKSTDVIWWWVGAGSNNVPHCDFIPVYIISETSWGNFFAINSLLFYSQYSSVYKFESIIIFT